jgi:hypothetical protein
MADSKNLLVGQLFFRETLQKRLDGKKLMIVVGLVAVPEHMDLEEIKGEHQYNIIGGPEKLGGLHIYTETMTARDWTKEARGETADGILQYPMWRV